MDSIVIRPWTVLEYFTQASTHVTNRGIQNDGEGSINVNHGGTQTNQHTSNSHNRVYNGTVYIYEAGSHERRLSPPDPSSNHATARDRWHPGSCSWVLKREMYQRWRSGEITRLWLHGKPGCGKTVLCSTIIEDLLEYHKDSPDIKLAYFYFTFSDNSKQSYADMLLSLVCQFGRHAPDLLSGVSPGADIHTLLRVLRSMLASFKALIILDALDESPEHLRRDLLQRLRILAEIPNVRILATARNEIDIAHSLEDLDFEQLPIRPEDVRGDIQDYAASQLECDSRLRRFKPEVKALIESNVCENADGMFRWAVLLLDALSGLRTSSSDEVLKALKEFPHDLDEVYTRILHQVPGKDQGRVFTLLRWITYAKRPLNLGELVEALVIRPEGDFVDVEDRCEPEDILRLLTSLVTTIAYTNYEGRIEGEIKADDPVDHRTKIRLAHFTVQEHLESDRFVSDTAEFHLEPRAAHFFLTQCCVTYLMHYSRSEVRKAEKTDYDKFPLLKYAAMSWYYHSPLHESSDVDLEMKLLMSETALASWLDAGDPEHPPFESSERQADGLYYAARVGGLTLVGRLLGVGAEINARGGLYDNALAVASQQGSVEMVRLLLNKGADDLNGALRYASLKGHLEIIKLLLAKGADDLNKALGYAALGGHLETIKLLLDKGADDLNGALGYASWNSHLDTVKLLLDKGADDLNRALRHASWKGHLETIKLLLDKGADVNAQGGMYRSALQEAAVYDHVEVVELLLANGADVNAQGGKYGSALRAAKETGAIRTVQLLKEHGAQEQSDSDTDLGLGNLHTDEAAEQ